MCVRVLASICDNLVCVVHCEGEAKVEQSSSILAALERQKLMAEVGERKRKMLREVEVSRPILIEHILS